MQYLLHQLQSLQTPLFCGIKRGIEREGLRVTGNGAPAQTPHPAAFEPKLTHSYITTDYSENLLELITPPCTNVDALIAGMENIYREVYEQLHDEWIWPQSLPCPLIGEIPIANYGTSPEGQIKMQYRRGLGLRYGREMQTIAGLHYNFSLPQSFWALWYNHIDPSHNTLQDCIDTQYFRMIRQHMRHVWILAYLFGASTAIHQSLLKDRRVPFLEAFDDNTFIGPNACALRLTPLGYYSQVQDDHLKIRFDSLQEYIDDMHLGMSSPYPPYVDMLRQYGPDSQLNANILQLENEFYHPIRPKRVPKQGQTTLQALSEKGVEYIEVRSIDLNPFEAIGISREQLLFLDVYLIFCLLKPSPLFLDSDQKAWLKTLHLVAYEGRKPGLDICYEDNVRSMRDVLKECFGYFEQIAALLDREYSDNRYTHAVQFFKKQIDQPELLLSSRYSAYLEECGSYVDAGILLARSAFDINA